MSAPVDVGHRWAVRMDRSAVVANAELPLMAGDGPDAKRMGTVVVVAIESCSRTELLGTHNFADPVVVTVEVVELEGRRHPREAERG